MMWNGEIRDIVVPNIRYRYNNIRAMNLIMTICELVYDEPFRPMELSFTSPIEQDQSDATRYGLVSADIHRNIAPNVSYDTLEIFRGLRFRITYYHLWINVTLGYGNVVDEEIIFMPVESYNDYIDSIIEKLDVIRFHLL